jgi:hypothetical protein
MELPRGVRRGAALVAAVLAGVWLDRWVLRDSPLEAALQWGGGGGGGGTRMGGGGVGGTPSRLREYDARVAAFEHPPHEPPQPPPGVEPAAEQGARRVSSPG